jgi:hypothetical protein
MQMVVAVVSITLPSPIDPYMRVIAWIFFLFVMVILAWGLYDLVIEMMGGPTPQNPTRSHLRALWLRPESKQSPLPRMRPRHPSPTATPIRPLSRSRHTETHRHKGV